MASIRSRPRADGTTAYTVNYRHVGRQSTLTFDSEADAETLLADINAIGAEKALNTHGITVTVTPKPPAGPTVTEWVTTHINSLTGVEKSTLYDYRRYLRRDIGPVLGHIPINQLTQADISAWVNAMHAAGSSEKTLTHKHGLLSAALTAAITAGWITKTPCAATRFPRSEKAEMVFLTGEEFQLLKTGFTPHWWPLLDFLVVTGARFGEVAALRPGDVNRERGTVFIGRSMKRTYEKGNPYEIGATKTAKGVRTISVTAAVLDNLNYSGDTLFVNTKGGPMRIASWRSNVFYPSRDRAIKAGLTKEPRIHDLRHSCATWMIAAGIPLPVVQQHLGHENIQTTISRYYHLDRRQSR